MVSSGDDQRPHPYTRTGAGRDENAEKQYISFGRFRFFCPPGSLRRSFLSGAIWTVSGAVFSRGFALLASVILARLLGKRGFGQWELVVSTVSMFVQFAIFGVALTATKHIAQLRNTDPGRAGRILSLALLTGLISVSIASLGLAAAAHWMAFHLFGVPELFPALLLAGLMVFGFVGREMLQGALAGFEDFRRIARINLVQGLVLLLAVPPLAWRWGIEGAVVAMSISQLTATALSLRATIQNCRDHGIPLTTVGIWQERAVLWRYAIPSLAGGAMSGPAATLSRALVAQIPGGVTALGGFAAAVRWRDIVLFIPGAVRQITLPILSRLRGGNDRQRYVKALWANIGVNAGIALIGSVPIVMMSPWILALYGSEFRRDWDLMAILVGSSVFQAVKDVLARVVASMGKMWWSVWMAIVWSAMTLGGAYLLVPRYGIRGYVWIVVVASVVNMAMYGVAAVALIGRWDRLSEAKIETPHD